MKTNLRPADELDAIGAWATEHAPASRIAIIIPVCNEEACIGPVLDELLARVDRSRFVVAIGVNNSTDRTAEIAKEFPVLVAETTERGYGYGCQAAIELLKRVEPSVNACIFFAGDGASDPNDLETLVAAYEQGYAMVLGERTTHRANWRTMTLPHIVANRLLGCWCGLLTGRSFKDLAPLRLIQRRLFEAIAPREMKFGWTIEAQIGAAMMGAAICEVPAHERRRLAGEQKVSGVTWRRTFSIGARIFVAGWRARKRFRHAVPLPALPRTIDLLAQSQTGA